MSRFRASVIATFLALGAAACGGMQNEGEQETAKGAAAPTPNANAVAEEGTDERVRRADMARIKGDSAAKVWMLIVSDFQCPYCKLWHDQAAAAIDREYVETGKLRIAYVHFPLRMHPNALPAAEASMCAGAQGKFWEYHNRIFEEQDKWSGLLDSQAVFEGIAQGLSLDVAAWRACMNDDIMLPMIRSDYERGTNAQVQSTPTFFIGDVKIEGAENVNVFRQAIDQALAAAK